MLSYALEFFLKLVACFGAMGVILLAVVWVERKSLGSFCGHGDYARLGKVGFKQIFADTVRLLFRGGKGNLLDDYLLTFVCLLIAFLPFIVFPFCGPVSWGQGQYYHLEMGVPFILMIQVFSQVVTHLIERKRQGHFQEIFVLRDFVNYINSRALAILVLLPLFAIYATFDFHQIVQKQSGHIVDFLPSYGIFLQPISAILFLICIQIDSSLYSFNTASPLARCHYQCLDGREVLLLEFAKKTQWLSLLFLYTFMFLGGYGTIPGFGYVIKIFPQMLPLIQVLSLAIKVVSIALFLSMINASLPKFRSIDITDLSAKRLLPLAFVNFLATLGYFLHKGNFL